MTSSIWRVIGVVLMTGWLGACTTLPVVDRERIASEAIPISKDTTLGRIASAYRPAEDHSGFTSKWTRPAVGCCVPCAMPRSAAFACDC
jgi:hypothetical protein